MLYYLGGCNIELPDCGKISQVVSRDKPFHVDNVSVYTLYTILHWFQETRPSYKSYLITYSSDFYVHNDKIYYAKAAHKGI